ncbi:hypothetical protein MKX03_036472, partial [Papaver bracteatum]
NCRHIIGVTESHASLWFCFCWEQETNMLDMQHQFNARESDCGFTSFMPLSELYDPSREFLAMI